MNVNINDQKFINSSLYQNFLSENPSEGFLKIRAYAASQAIPIQGLKVVVSTNMEDYNVIFYEGYTDNSGTIEKIVLPTPKLNSSDLVTPASQIYTITATYLPDNKIQTFKVNLFENVSVVQSINIVPDMNRLGD